MSPKKYRKHLDRIKEILFWFYHGDEPPQDSEDYLLWWLIRENFYRPNARIPTRIPGNTRIKAESRAKKLIRKLDGILNKLQSRPRLPKGNVDALKAIPLREELYQHIEAVGGRKLRRTTEELEELENLQQVEPPIVETVEPEAATVEVPLTLQFELNGGMIADKQTVLNEIKKAFSGEGGEALDAALKSSPYLQRILNKDSEDPIQLGMPSRLALPQPGPRKHRRPPNLKKVQKAIRAHFKKNKYCVEWFNGAWVVTIPEFYPDGREAVFRATEDDYGGVAGTGISFQAL